MTVSVKIGLTVIVATVIAAMLGLVDVTDPGMIR